MLIKDLKGGTLNNNKEPDLTDYALTYRLNSMVENFPSVITHPYKYGPDKITLFLAKGGYIDAVPRERENDNYEYVINIKGFKKLEEMREAHPEWFKR